MSAKKKKNKRYFLFYCEELYGDYASQNELMKALKKEFEFEYYDKENVNDNWKVIVGTEHLIEISNNPSIKIK